MRSVRLGSLFRIPLFLHPSFFLLPLWVLFLSRNQGPTGILFGQVILFSIFACVVLHELGHALMARFFGIGTQDITLYPIGGVARMESTGNAPHEEVCIALAGPAVNLGIVVLLAPFALLAYLGASLYGQPAGLLGVYLMTLCLANGVLLLFNLIPAFPMDGGRVLRALLSLGLGRLRATEVAATVALLLAGGLGLLGVVSFNISLILVSMFVAFAGQAELAALRRFEARQRLDALPAHEVIYSQPSATVVMPPTLGQFTGYLWDRENNVWVRWVNGRPEAS